MYLPPCGPDEERIGVVVAVPEPWMSELSAARVKYGDPAGNITPAHITLLPPTTILKEKREKVIEHLQNIASAQIPFNLTISGTGSFRPISPVVYVNVTKGGQNLIDLEGEVRSGILDIPTRFPYHPHVTIAQKVSEELLDEAYEDLAEYEASWLVQSFRLDRVGDDGSYQSQAIFNFSNSRA